MHAALEEVQRRNWREARGNQGPVVGRVAKEMQEPPARGR